MPSRLHRTSPFPLGSRLHRLLAAAALALALPTGAVLAQAGGGNSAQLSRYYEDALQRYEKQDLAGAIIQLKNALQIDRNAMPVQLLLGKALLANSEPAAAEVALREAMRLGVSRAEVLLPLGQALISQGKQGQLLEQSMFAPDPNLPRPVLTPLLLLRASAQGDLGETQAALESVRQARALNEQAPESWLAEVQIRLRQGLLDEALTAAERARSLAPHLPEAQYQLGSTLHLRGDPRGAQAAYERTLQLDAAHVEARLARAGLHIDAGRDAQAAADVAEVLKRSRGEPRAVYLQALLAERAGNPRASRAKLAEVTALMDPVPIEFVRYRPQLLLVNGLSHFGLDEYLKAKPYLEAFQRGQSNSPVAKLLAQIYIKEGSPDRAVEVLENYLHARPSDPQAITLLASVHMAQGRHNKASALLQQALGRRDVPEFRTALGLSLLGRGQAPDARAQLEAVYKKDSSQISAGLGLASAYMREGQPAQARQIADSLIKRQGNNPVLYNLLGAIKLDLHDHAGARSAFERALTLAPDLLQPKLGLARAEAAAGQFDAAAQRLQALLKLDEKNIDALLELARLAERRGQASDATRWLQKAVDLAPAREMRPGFALLAHYEKLRDAPAMLETAKLLLARAPEDANTLLAYARAQLANGNAGGARQTLTNAARRAQPESGVLLEIANAQFRAGDLNSASYSLERRLSAQPDSPEALAMLASVELRQGAIPRAEARVRQVLQLEPKRAASHTLAAELALAKRDRAGALDALKRAHALQPSSATLLRLFAQQEPTDRRGAWQLAERWLKSRPSDSPVLRALADSQARAGDYAAATQSYQRVLKAQPRNAAVLNNLANALALSGKPAEAQKSAEGALQADPGFVPALDTLGWLHFQQGRADQALRLLRDARLRAPQDPDIRYHLAAVLAQAGRAAEARAELDAALQMGREFESAAAAEKLRETLK